MAKERIGVFHGAFDPIRQDHIRIALSALDTCHLNLLYILPAEDQPMMPCVADQEDRWKMVVTACTQDGRLVPSRFEMDNGISFFSMDVLLALRKKHPKASLFYILSVEEMMKLHRWNHLNEAFQFCSFLICSPKEDQLPDTFFSEKARLTSLGGRFTLIRIESVPISSNEVQGRPSQFQGFFSPIREYCALKGLYGLHLREDRAEMWINRLFCSVNPRRFAHSLSVAGYARHLARIHGIDQRQAEQAGLLHDCAKCLPLKELQRIAVEHSLTDDPTILSSNALMHSLVGAWIARNEYGMADPEVLEAIAYHNTGHAGMSRLAMCVCLADSIEPLRQSYPLLEQIRLLAEISLERALLMSLEGTAAFVRSRGKYLHPRTQETIAWLKTLPEVRTQRK